MDTVIKSKEGKPINSEAVRRALEKKKGGGGGGGCLPQKKCCGFHTRGGGGGGHISAKGATKGPKSRGFQRFLDNKQRVRSNQSIIAQLTVHSTI